MSERRRLGDLQVGEGGIIEALDGEPSMVQRLTEMGLIPGSRVQVVRVAPLGDPLEIRVRGYPLSIRRANAASVILAAEPEAPQ